MVKKQLRGQWEVIPNWGVRNIFNGAAVEIKSNMNKVEHQSFIERIQRLLNQDRAAKQ